MRTKERDTTERQREREWKIAVNQLERKREARQTAREK